MTDNLVVSDKDILIKAAEGAAQGLHCKGYHLSGDLEGGRLINSVEYPRMVKQLDGYQNTLRCAEGELYLAGALLGASYDQTNELLGWVNTYSKAAKQILTVPEKHYRLSLFEWNDEVLPDDPFEAGQMVANLFRACADEIEE